MWDDLTRDKKFKNGIIKGIKHLIIRYDYWIILHKLNRLGKFMNNGFTTGNIIWYEYWFCL